jgi:hypothetical protein
MKFHVQPDLMLLRTNYILTISPVRDCDVAWLDARSLEHRAAKLSLCYGGRERIYLRHDLNIGFQVGKCGLTATRQ